MVAVIFAAELLLRSVVQPNYIFSFFFWLDVVAVGSIVPDVLPLFESKDDDDEGERRAANAKPHADAASAIAPSSPVSSPSTPTPLCPGDTDAAARAGRIARAGTKVGRMLRLLRIVRVIKLLFLSAHGRQSQADVKYNSSALGKELKSRISKITIVFILSLLIGDALLR
eukprot:scaffold35214_cov129-Isochrysis_galbana.AAC.1